MPARILATDVTTKWYYKWYHPREWVAAAAVPTEGCRGPRLGRAAQNSVSSGLGSGAFCAGTATGASSGGRGTSSCSASHA